MFKTYEYNKDDYRDKVMTEATKHNRHTCIGAGCPMGCWSAADWQGEMCSITSCSNNADTWITRTITLLGERLSATMPMCERHLEGERP